MTKSAYTILLFYTFTRIRNPVKFAELHRTKCQALGLKGRMIVGEEGVNATFEGTTENTDKYKRFLKRDPLFKKVVIKESVGTGSAFPRLAVKVRDEIVTLGAGKFNVKRETATQLPAKELEKWYKENKDFIVLDLRNDYEIASGKFERTIDPGLKNFRDLPNKIKKLAKLKNKKVVTVCTGGIRCEKATCLLKREGFTDIYQLKDGIHTYMKEYPGSNFKGTLFVFDNRMTTDVVPTPDKIVVGTCAFCKSQTENYYSDDSVRPSRKVLCCKKCAQNQFKSLRSS
ncbi:MAG: rhodanese-related sulfurtransferase [Candidatus Pacebacteria bacterium]|nr:rhodanese-related sulfurtransferase [Candidatus Paceibacterota bacterium]